MPVPDKENYREAVCDVDRNVAHCFFQSSTKKPAQKTPACPIAGETALFGRKLCEEFAPRNEDIRLSEGRGANRPRTRAAISESCGPWFAYVTESSGLAGSRTQTVPESGPPISEFPVRGSRPETEIKGLAGSRARTMPAPGPPISEFPARGSRPETEIKGLAGS